MKTNKEIIEVYDLIKNYFISKGYRKNSSMLCESLGIIEDLGNGKRNIPTYPFVIKRNWFLNQNKIKCNLRELWKNDTEKYDKFILEHITNICLKYNITEISFITTNHGEPFIYNLSKDGQWTVVYATLVPF